MLDVSRDPLIGHVGIFVAADSRPSRHLYANSMQMSSCLTHFWLEVKMSDIPNMLHRFSLTLAHRSLYTSLNTFMQPSRNVLAVFER